MDNANRRETDVVNDNEIFRKISSDTAVNLKFTDLLYEVKDQTTKVILNSVSGEFRAGELSAIIGLSGSGKTTLLNLLAGYRTKHKAGDISVNDLPLNRTKFRKISRYVLQEDHICPYFTVAETMMMASKFKLATHYSREERQSGVNSLLEFFHLQGQANTRISKISGGERKRVCIALELINHPAVLFLDEPTTGLDESTAFQCIQLLKQLASYGHTVICSLHSPSYRLLQMIDRIYTLAEGQCVYQGEVGDIVQYLEHFGLRCPTTYNPADFIIESTTHVYGNFHEQMVNAVNNGKVLYWPPLQAAINQSPIEQTTFHSLDMETKLQFNERRNVSWSLEYKWLLLRMLKLSYRDKINLRIRIFVHLFLVALIGYAYAGVGYNAHRGMYNYHFTLITVVLSVFTSMSPVLVTSCSEMKYLQRQLFNRWYRLSSYFMALLTSHLIMVTLMSIVGSAFLYFGSGQPLQFFRFALFTGIILLTSMVASSYGLLFGSRLNIEHALFLAPAVMTVYIMIANYATERPHLSTLEKGIMYSSCLRYPVEGILAALFNYNRSNLICPPSEFFCVMSNPKYLLKLVGSLNVDYGRSVAGLLGFYILFSVLAFMNFRWRLMGERISLQNSLSRYLCSTKSPQT